MLKESFEVKARINFIAAICQGLAPCRRGESGIVPVTFEDSGELASVGSWFAGLQLMAGKRLVPQLGDPLSAEKTPHNDSFS